MFPVENLPRIENLIVDGSIASESTVSGISCVISESLIWVISDLITLNFFCYLNIVSIFHFYQIVLFTKITEFLMTSHWLRKEPCENLVRILWECLIFLNFVKSYQSIVHRISKELRRYTIPLISVTSVILLVRQLYILYLCLRNKKLGNFNSLPNSISGMKSKRTVGPREMRNISKYHQGSHKTKDT